MNRHSVPNATHPYPDEPKNGASKPRFYGFDDGIVRLVKWHPSSHGPKACYNELVASRLGQLVDAPILRGGIVYVSGEVIPEEHQSFAQEGFHFGVMKMEDGENFVPELHYNQITNVTELPVALVFLRWLRIGDQATHNQFLYRVRSSGPWSGRDLGPRFQLMDLGHMFESGRWKGSTSEEHPHVELPNPVKYVDPPHLVEKVADAELQSALVTLRSVSESEIQACFRDVPDEWQIPTEDMESGGAYAIFLRDQLIQRESSDSDEGVTV